MDFLPSYNSDYYIGQGSKAEPRLAVLKVSLVHVNVYYIMRTTVSFIEDAINDDTFFDDYTPTEYIKVLLLSNLEAVETSRHAAILFAKACPLWARL